MFARMARDVLPELERASGLRLDGPVRIALRTQEELLEYLEAGMAEEMDEEEFQDRASVYKALGLFPEDADLRALLLEVLLQQVVGFYEPDSLALFIVEGKSGPMLASVLIHELAHALQHQRHNLDSLLSRELDNDARLAAQAAIEGHATLVMTELLLREQFGRGLAMEDFGGADAFVGGAGIRSALSATPSLENLPAVLRMGLVYPYYQGAAYALRSWRDGAARGDVLGPLLPRTTEDVASLRRSDPPPALEMTAERVRLEDNLGHMELGVLMEEWGIPDADGALNDGWAADRYQLYSGDPEGPPSLRWIVLWDDPASRDRFVQGARRAPGRPSGLEVQAAQVDGWPASEIVSGAPPPARTRVVGGES